MSDEKRRSSPVKSGLLIFLLSIFISAALFTMTYFPYKSYLELKERCTEPTSGIVTEEGSQVKDNDKYYYGPMVEYTVYAQGRTIRAQCVNTVNLNTEWSVNEAVALYYDPSDPATVILRNDSAALDNYRTAVFGSIIIIAAGLCVFIAGAVKHFIAARPTKYKTNAAGQTFEEWQKDTACRTEVCADKAEETAEGEKPSDAS